VQRLARAVLLLLSCIGALLSSNALAAPEQMPTDLKSGARNLFRELCGTSVDSTDDPVAIMTVGKGQFAGLGDDLCEIFRSEWRHSLPAEYAESALARLTFNAADLRNDRKRQLFLSMSGARTVLLVTVESTDRDIELSATKVGAESEPKSWEVVVLMTDEIRHYLDLPVPATVRISAPGGSTVSVGGQVVGHGGSTVVTRMPAGSHQLQIDKAGYAPFRQDIRVDNDQRLAIKVKVKSSAGAPFAATLSSMLVPGLASVLYGRPKAERDVNPTNAEFGVYFGAVCCYVGAGMWLTDELSPDKKKILTKESQDRYEKTQKMELAAAAGGYVLNVVSAYFVGVDYAAKNREMVRYADAMPEGGAGLDIAVQAEENGPRMSLAYNWRF